MISARLSVVKCSLMAFLQTESCLVKVDFMMPGLKFLLLLIMPEADIIW